MHMSRGTIKTISSSCFQFAGALTRRNQQLAIIRGKSDSFDWNDFRNRLEAYGFWGRKVPIEFTRWSHEFILPNRTPLCYFGPRPPFVKLLRALRGSIYWVDDSLNPEAGWEWCDLALDQFILNGGRIPDTSHKFRRIVEKLQQLSFQRCYVFGTGPSLARAIERDWSDGVRVVCNTIVRDKELWNHINPHFVVAGDGIYHFGYTEHAKAFRRDLAVRLKETDTYFLLPDRFYPMVIDELADSLDRVLPVPVSASMEIGHSLAREYKLPGLPNVLNMLLLPLGCTLAKTVALWGFDGRAPSDTLFWSNSSKQSYPELMAGLRQAHPAFFEAQVPKSDPAKYVRAVHGDLLEQLLSSAEARGWTFMMLHDCWTPTLQRRRRDP
jgi:hypothetical protein